MSYLIAPRRPVKRGRRSLGDFWSDLLGINLPPASSSTSTDTSIPPPPDVSADSEQGSTSSSSTVQDTSIGPGGGVIGGQDTGVPTAPVGLWKNINGVCYGTSSSFMESIKTLQRQLNRVATAKSVAPIGVDGAVGGETLGLMRKVGALGAYAQVGTGTPSSCDTVCSGIYAYIAATQAFADGLGVSSSVASPAPATTPSYFDPKAGQMVNQSPVAAAGDIFGNMSSTTQMAVLGGSALLAAWAYTGSKKSARRAKSRRTRRY